MIVNPRLPSNQLNFRCITIFLLLKKVETIQTNLRNDVQGLPRQQHRAGWHRKKISRKKISRMKICRKKISRMKICRKKISRMNICRKKMSRMNIRRKKNSRKVPAGMSFYML